MSRASGKNPDWSEEVKISVYLANNTGIQADDALKTIIYEEVKTPSISATNVTIAAAINSTVTSTVTLTYATGYTYKSATVTSGTAGDLTLENSGNTITVTAATELTAGTEYTITVTYSKSENDITTTFTVTVQA